MLARASSAFLLLALPLIAAAGGNPPASQCSGSVQCCKSVQKSGTPSVSHLLGVLGIVVQGANIPLGLTCNPISVIGVGGNSCNFQPVCCTGNNFNGAVVVGCTPVNLNL